MELKSIIKKSTLLLAFAGMSLMTPAPAKAVNAPTSVALSTAAVFVASCMYTYSSNAKFDGPSHYNTTTMKTAWLNVLRGIDVKRNLAVLRQQLYYFYNEGICGHPGKEGSPRLNEKTGLHELPVMPSRGAMGWIHDHINPLKNAVELVKYAAEFGAATSVGYALWQGLLSQKTFHDARVYLQTKPAALLPATK